MRSSQSSENCPAHFIRALLITSALTFVTVQHASAEDLALKDAVSMTGMALFLSSGAPALTIAVVRGDESIVQGFGKQRPAMISNRIANLFSASAQSPRSLRPMSLRRWQQMVN